MSIKEMSSVLRPPSTQTYSLKVLVSWDHFLHLSMAILPVYLDWAHRVNETRSSCIVQPKRSAFVARKVRWDLKNYVCCLSTTMVDLSEFGKKKKYGEEFLRKTACV